MDEKRINGGYEIIESCTIGNNELVIGHNAKAPNPYVCWYYAECGRPFAEPYSEDDACQ